MKLKKQLLVATLTLGVAASCGKKDDSKDSEESSEEEGGGTGSIPTEISESGISGVVPGTLMLSAFPQVSGAGLNLTEEDKGETPKQKEEEIKKRLKGEGECFDKGAFAEPPEPAITCYEFDTDMNPFLAVQNGQTKQFGTKTGKHTTGEACMVAFARKEMKDSERKVDRAIAMASALVCQAKKKQETKFPEVGETVDLLQHMQDAMGAEKDKMPVTEAAISRLADVDGSPVFRTDIKVKDKQENTMEIHLIHSPKADKTESGTLSILHRPKGQAVAQQQQGADPNNSNNKNHLMSISYQKTLNAKGEEIMTLSLERAALAITYDTPFTDAGKINWAAVPKEAQNNQIHAIKYVGYNVNTTTNEADLSYWMNPGGNYNESARGFLFNIKAGADGQLAGCGISGATADISIRKSIDDPTNSVLKPVRYWHPFDNQNTSPDKDPRFTGNQGNAVTEQCFIQNKTTGLYEIDTTKTAHAYGYEVKETAAVSVLPPPRPKKQLNGDFLPPKS